MEPHELSPSLLEALVDVVATLGELAATMATARRRERPLLYPESLHAALTRFTWHLRDTLDHHGVTSLRHRGVTSLGQALAALRANPGVTWADVRTAARAWLESVEVLQDNWYWLVEEAADLLDAWEDAATTEAMAEATTEATAEATATGLAGDEWDKTASLGTAEDNMVASGQQPPVALAKDEADSAVATHEARVAAASKAMEEIARGLLGRLVVMCDKTSTFSSELHDRLVDIEATLAEIKEATPDVPEALVTTVAEFERLWEASTHLTTHHLLGALGDIHDLLLSPYGGSGCPDGPSGRVVAKRCQNAIKDIPRLLEDRDVTAVMSSGQ